MDVSRFDQLARALSDVGSRRGLLHRITALPLVGGLAALLGTDATDAKGRRQRRKKRHKHGKGNGRHRKKNHKKNHKDKRKKTCPNIACPAGTICDAEACQACDVSCAAQEDAAVCGTRLQAMIVNGPDRIRVCPGTYGGSFPIDRDVEVIGAGEGEDPAANTILQGTGTLPVVVIPTTRTVTLQSLHITGGGGAVGSGIFNGPDSTLTLIGTTVTGNTATSTGGGIVNDTSTLTLIGSTVTDNEAAGAGGIFNSGGNVVIDADSQVTLNTADVGGGVYNLGGEVTLASNQIVLNNCPDNCAGDTIDNCAAEPISCPPV